MRWESVIIALFGTIGGLAVGSLLGWGLVRALDAQEGFGTFALPVTQLGVVLALAARPAWSPPCGPPGGPPRPTSSPPSPPTSENDQQMNGSSLNPLRPWRHPLRLWLTMCFNVTALVGRRHHVHPHHRLRRNVVRPVDHVRASPCRSSGCRSCSPAGSPGFERGRIAALAAVRIVDPVPPLTATGWWGRLKERVRSKPRWREIAYHLAHLPVAAISLCAHHGGVVRLDGDGAAAAVRRRPARRLGEVLLLRDHPGRRRRCCRCGRSRRPRSSSPRG